MTERCLTLPLGRLLAEWPWVDDFLGSHGIDGQRHAELSFPQAAGLLGEEALADLGTTRTQLEQDFTLFVHHMLAFQEGHDTGKRIGTLSVRPGFDKSGDPERHTLELRPGEVTALVGPTGAGKSRLLEDIECLAQGDTPTGRVILVNGQAPSEELRFSTEERLVAQLSQNMNFVMDLSVEDFLTLHAESRMVEQIAHLVERIFATANELAGERFTRSTPITQLSGGQSRALMVADTALLSGAPVVLIDEIENAGVDKVKALELLTGSRKIVLMSTHDPVLALSAQQRVVIRNGGIHDILRTSLAEQARLGALREMDATLMDLRQRLRSGGTLEA
nr:ATP-binding cassette domain-containing protein [uncultured Holophaga sp.]